MIIQNLKIFFLTAALIITAAGCAGKAAWKHVPPEQAKHTGNLGFTAQLPPQWLMFEDKPSRSLLLTKHSAAMDFIHLKRQRLFTPLPYTMLTVNAGMQTYEIAEVVINNLRATPGVFDLVTEELAPVEVGGAEGFELLLSYTMENGMRRRCLIYGVIVNDKYYAEAGLYALEDYYFDTALEDFLTMVESLEIK